MQTRKTLQPWQTLRDKDRVSIDYQCAIFDVAVGMAHKQTLLNLARKQLRQARVGISVCAQIQRYRPIFSSSKTVLAKRHSIYMANEAKVVFHEGWLDDKVERLMRGPTLTTRLAQRRKSAWRRWMSTILTLLILLLLTEGLRHRDVSMMDIKEIIG